MANLMGNVISASCIKICPTFNIYPCIRIKIKTIDENDLLIERARFFWNILCQCYEI